MAIPLGWGWGYISYRFHLVRPTVRPPAKRDSAGIHHGTHEASSWERVYKPPATRMLVQQFVHVNNFTNIKAPASLSLFEWKPPVSSGFRWQRASIDVINSHEDVCMQQPYAWSIYDVLFIISQTFLWSDDIQNVCSQLSADIPHPNTMENYVFILAILILLYYLLLILV